MENKIFIFEFEAFDQCYKIWDVIVISNKPYMVILNPYYC